MSPTKNLEKLWMSVFGEPPSIKCEPEMLAQILVAGLPSAPPYRAGPRANGSATEVEEAIYLGPTKA